MVIHTGKCFHWYGSDDLKANIELPICPKYNLGDFLAIRPLNWDEIINEVDDVGNWADAEVPSGESSHPGDGNDNDDGKGEEDTQGGQQRTGKRKEVNIGKGRWKATKEVKGKWKARRKDRGRGRGTGTGTEKGNVLLNKPHKEKAQRAVQRLQGARGMGHRGLTGTGIFRAACRVSILRWWYRLYRAVGQRI